MSQEDEKAVDPTAVLISPGQPRGSALLDIPLRDLRCATAHDRSRLTRLVGTSRRESCPSELSSPATSLHRFWPAPGRPTSCWSAVARHFSTAAALSVP